VRHRLGAVRAYPESLTSSQARALASDDGFMVDVSVSGVAIVYQVHVKVRAVEIVDISRILL